MSNSFPTPDGKPQSCSICGGKLAAKPQPLGELVCAPCGKLLSLFRQGWGGTLGVDPNRVRLDTRLTEMGMDSLETVALVMEVEEYFDLNITDEDAGQLMTLGDLIRWIRQRQSNPGEPNE